MRFPTTITIALATLLVSQSCQLPTTPRLPDDVQTTLRIDDMRRMETDHLVLYYPAHQAGAVKRLASRVGQCQKEMLSYVKIRNQRALEKPMLVIPDVPFNNAFVAPDIFGERIISVIPLGQRIDLFGIPFDPSYVGCHEIVHYIHFLQVAGLWGKINSVFGNVINPHVGSEPWVFEGLATFYESKLVPGSGRMAWPLWRGFFQAGYATKRLGASDFSAMKRAFHGGNHYLVGSHFIEYIANTYGEEALWTVVATQGSRMGLFFNTASNWKRATGKRLPSLINEFSVFVKKNFPKRSRPPTQKLKSRLANNASYAASRDGRTEVIIQSGLDEQTTLLVYQDDTLVRKKKLVDIIPPSRLVVASGSVSGLSVTADGRDVYFVSVDLGSLYQESRLIRFDVPSDTWSIVHNDLMGLGGSISDDGDTYYFSQSSGDVWQPAMLSISKKTARVLYRPSPRTYFSKLRPSPDSKTLVGLHYREDGYRIALVDIEQRLPRRFLKLKGAVSDPRWLDDKTIVFVGEVFGRFQVHLWHLDDDRVEIISDAPYAAISPWLHRNNIRFLNREDWQWTLDEVPLEHTKKVSRTDVHIESPTHPLPHLQSRSPRIISDAPYSQTDGLFIPSFRFPLYLNPHDKISLFGLTLFGGDRLSFHRWSLSLIADHEFKDFGGHVSYTTTLFAPYMLTMNASRLAYHKKDDQPFSEESVLFGFGRRRRLSLILLSFLGVQDKEPGHTNSNLHLRRLAGPGVTFSHGRFDSTPYGDIRRGYRIDGSTYYHPKDLNSLDRNMWHLSGSLSVFLSPPFSKRHGLQLSIQSDVFTNADPQSPLLEVGGPTAPQIWSNRDSLDLDDSDVLPGDGLFQIALRGFEDTPFRTNKIFTSHITYRFPFIVDRGVASLLYFLPGLFIRNLEIDIFGTGATPHFSTRHDDAIAAAGSSLTLKTFLGFIPLDLRLQTSKRLFGDRAWLHWVSLGQFF